MSTVPSAPERPLTLAACDTAEPMTAVSGAAPAWVQLLPLGRIKGRDGRAWTLSDPAALIADFTARNADLPIDYGHQSDTPPAGHTGPVPAAGWIKELRLAANGIWGRVEWTDRARDLIGEKAYRFLSPVFWHDKAGEILRLKGAGLVHNPNLQLKALAAEVAPMTQPPTPEKAPDPAAMLAKIASLLGMAPDTDPAALLAALEKALAAPDPKKFVPVAAVQEMLRDRNAQLSILSEEAAGAKVDDALRRGYITPGLKPWALALCRQDPDSFDAFLSGAVPAFAHLTKPVLPGAYPDRPGAGAVSPEETAICAQLGLKPGSLSI